MLYISCRNIYDSHCKYLIRGEDKDDLKNEFFRHIKKEHMGKYGFLNMKEKSDMKFKIFKQLKQK